MSLLWRYFTPCSSVSIVNFEHVIVGSLAVSQAKIIDIMRPDPEMILK